MVPDLGGGEGAATRLKAWADCNVARLSVLIVSSLRWVGRHSAVCDSARHAVQKGGDQGHGESPQLTGRLDARHQQTGTDYEQTQHADPSQPQQPTRTRSVVFASVHPRFLWTASQAAS